LANTRGCWSVLESHAGEKSWSKKLGSGQVYGTPFGLATFHVVCGEIELAADWIEKAIEERFLSSPFFLQSAIGEPLRASLRSPKLAALLNLPEGASPRSSRSGGYSDAV
jgi:hypothetical protein